MADFLPAFLATDADEGGWVHDRQDPGGETYRGVTRRDHPSWRGWRLFDEARARRGAGDPPLDFNDATWRQLLEPDVRDLFRTRYWEAIRGDSLPTQDLANELYDSAVNMGVGPAVRLLQRALNILNRSGVAWADVECDGDLGPRTRAAVAACCASAADAALLVDLVNALQAARYVELAERNPTLERFMRGWLRNRARLGQRLAARAA